MYIAVAVGTMMFGAWVLTTPPDIVEDTEETVVVGETTEKQTVPPAPFRRPENMTERGPVSTQEARAKQERRQIQRSMIMPEAPTDPMADQAIMGQPTPPTTPPPAMGQYGPGMTPGMTQPMAPTARRSYGSPSSTGYHPMSRSMVGPTTRPQSGNAMITPPNMMTTTTQQPPQKAFSGYRPTSGVSPYMNLFRRDSGVVDNYTTLVRPELEQRYLNQRMGSEIRNLEQNYQRQGLSLQQIQMMQNRTLQGVATPQYYMNYGNYYNYGSGQ